MNRIKTKPVKIEIQDIPKIFSIDREDKKYKLKIGRARPITIEIPFILDKNIAKICAMIMDGCISKKLDHCMFSQKKDKEKVKQFGQIIKVKFNIKPRYSEQNNDVPIVTIGSKSVCNFLYYCLDVHKSDEDARIPRWIWESPTEIIKEYIRYAFAMEGSISDPKKGKYEIRFHSCDKSYLIQLSRLLKKKFSIKTSIYSYFVKGYGMKYYLTISDQENITKFSSIGFALKSHQKRLQEMINGFKNKAWEITLVKLLNLKKRKFHIKDVHHFFPFLCRRAIHWRLTELVNMNYLILSKDGYSLTNTGKFLANLLVSHVKITKLRTNPRENEKRVSNHLKNGNNYISQIARDLKLNVNTVRDTLRRLENENKVELIEIDKFQRKIWRMVDSGGSPEAGT